MFHLVHSEVAGVVKEITWQLATRRADSPDPAVASRRTDAHHRSGCGFLGQTGLVGGTLYFALMGVVMVIAAVLIFRNRRGGILLYAVAFIASVIWAISDAGWNYWPLFSRLFALGVLAFGRPVWPFLASPPAKKARPMASPPFSPWRWR